MSSDDARRVPDAPFKPLGIGMFATFACGRCRGHRRIFGRRMQSVRGLRQWVCAECASKAREAQK